MEHSLDSKIYKCNINVDFDGKINYKQRYTHSDL